MRTIACAAVFLAMTATTATTARAADQAIIVLDGSGSMWGQIDGTPKISIARDVLDDVLTAVPRDLWLGLMAYGHRQKGDCTDIELIIAPAPGAAAEIVGTARDLSPKGKTPLSAAVQQAAEALKYTEAKATVILITDGLETCSADPCALARELEAGGIDFTAHVVGFGLSAEEGRQVACLAEETGGKYIQADNGDALTDALTETVAEVVEPPPPPEAPAETVALPEAALDAPDSIEIGRTFDVFWEGPGERGDHLFLVDPAGNNGNGRDLRGVRLVNADFDNRRVPLVAPVTPGTYELQYRYNHRTVIAARPIEVLEAEVSLSAPAAADIGTTVVVDWVGPGGRRDSIQLFDPAARQGEGALIRERRLANEDYENRQVRIILPTEPGFYQLRYWNGDDRKVLASREIEVLTAEVSLGAPDSVDIGRPFELAWVGPGAVRDSIEIYDPAGNNGNGRVAATVRVRNGDFEGRTVKMTAPTEAGDYELRYWSGDSRAVLATRPLAIAATQVSISGPESVEMGRTFTVTWVGPGGNRDMAEVYDPDGNNGNGRVVYSKRLVNDDYDKQTVKLIAPVEARDYELRYWDGNGRTVLASSPVTVVATVVSLTAPDNVPAGEWFTAGWVGPGATRDSIEVISGDPLNGRIVTGGRVINGDYDAQTVKLRAPKEPGDYTLRYWNGEFKALLATRSITVE